MTNIRIILIYDIKEERVTKVMKICRQYLEHIQNSVFEGDVTDADLRELRMKLNEIIKKAEDSVIVFHLWSSNYKKEVLGLNKNDMDNIV